MNVFTIDTNFRKLKEGVLNILFPKECVGCRSEGSYLCQACLGTIFINEKFLCSNCEDPTIFGATCSRCLRRDFPLDSLISITSYRDKFIREAISSLKYKGCELVIDDLRILFQKFFLKYGNIFPQIDLIIPVPLHPWRLEERGFNQSELIAQEIFAILEAKLRCTLQAPMAIGAERRKLSLDNSILFRIKNNPPQVQLDSKERLKNVANIFEVTNRELLVNKSILLVDDVYTSGATMQECARVLKSAGVREVHGFVIARS